MDPSAVFMLEKKSRSGFLKVTMFLCVKTNKCAKETLLFVMDLNGSSEDSCYWLSRPKRDHSYQESCLLF